MISYTFKNKVIYKLFTEKSYITVAVKRIYVNNINCDS